MTIEDFMTYKIVCHLLRNSLPFLRHSSMNTRVFYKTTKAGAKINYSDVASSVNLPENGRTKRVSAIHA